jgi:hypothetical protein
MSQLFLSRNIEDMATARQVSELRLIGDELASSASGHYLSDHFGLSLELVAYGDGQP